MKYNMKYVSILVLFTLAFLPGCATYTTPAAGVDLGSISDVDIAELMAREPQANFPARMAIARVQSSAYTSRTNYAYGTGRYSVVTTRDIEDDASIESMSMWPGLQAVAPVGRLLLPEQLDSLKDIRLAAAYLKADMLLVYSIDTAFHVEGEPLGPLSVISLGFIPNKKAHVSTTTSGVIIDVRTGFVYGVAEVTESEHQRSTMWSTKDAIDNARLKSEAASFKSFVKESEKLWANIVAEHSKIGE